MQCHHMCKYFFDNKNLLLSEHLSSLPGVDVCNVGFSFSMQVPWCKQCFYQLLYIIFFKAYSYTLVIGIYIYVKKFFDVLELAAF